MSTVRLSIRRGAEIRMSVFFMDAYFRTPGWLHLTSTHLALYPPQTVWSYHIINISFLLTLSVQTSVECDIRSTEKAKDDRGS